MTAKVLPNRFSTSYRTGLLFLLFIACGQPRPPLPEDAPERESAQTEKDVFVEVAAASGLDFVHFNGMTGEFYFSEIMGAGGALLDFDRDGDLDVFLVQGRLLGSGKEPGDALFPYTGAQPPLDRLFRNDTQTQPGGEAKLVFTDVTAQSGIDHNSARRIQSLVDVVRK